jgi:hypothetical protein
MALAAVLLVADHDTEFSTREAAKQITGSFSDIVGLRSVKARGDSTSGRLVPERKDQLNPRNPRRFVPHHLPGNESKKVVAFAHVARRSRHQSSKRGDRLQAVRYFRLEPVG